jgi:hypothetical protein
MTNFGPGKGEGVSINGSYLRSVVKKSMEKLAKINSQANAFDMFNNLVLNLISIIYCL